MFMERDDLRQKPKKKKNIFHRRLMIAEEFLLTHVYFQGEL